MTKATLDALVQVDRVLHEAGWDQLGSSAEPGSDLKEMTHQLETLSLTPYWVDLCKTIKEYYRKACGSSEGMSSPRNPN